MAAPSVVGRVADELVDLGLVRWATDRGRDGRALDDPDLHRRLVLGRLVAAIDDQRRAGSEPGSEEEAGERFPGRGWDAPAGRTWPHGGVVALLHEELARIVGELDHDVVLGHLPPNALHQEADALEDLDLLELGKTMTSSMRF